jgi:signal transduction histidine kinase
MRLRTQFTLGFAIVVLIGAGVTGALLIAYSYQMALHHLKDKQLLLARTRAQEINEEVVGEVGRLQYLATLADLDLTDANLDPEKNILRHAQTESPFFTVETTAIAPGGEVLWSEPGHIDTGSVAGQAWFQVALTKHESFVTEDDTPKGVVKGRVVVPLWHKDGRFAGCLTSTMDATTAARWGELLRNDLGRTGTAALMDRGGHQVVATGQPMEALLGLSEAVGQALHGTESSAWARDTSGRTWLLTSVPLKRTGWALLFRQARDELDDDVDPELVTFGVMLLLGLSLALAFGVRYSRALAEPIVALARVARAVEQGHFEGVPSPTRTDELGDLERAFFSMTATLDARVRERTRQLEQAQALLVEQGRFAAMGKTAAAIAHELKNALNGLGVAVELLTQGKLTENQQEPIREQVRSEVARLRDITDNLNIFAGPPRLNLSPTSLETLVRRAVAVLADRVEGTDIALEVDVPEGLPPVACDGQKLQGVLINLVKNAVEAVEPALDAPDGTRGHVKISAVVDADAVELSVSDDGPGMTEDAAGHMFEPFFTTKRTGTGLGLTIGRKVVEAHGGSLTRRPKAERGTTMVVRLPLRPPDGVAPTRPPAPLAPTVQGQGGTAR